uniref:Nuclear cap-binding protein subunit 3 n=1 Tax=Strigamia maritima TaxID=126957 RepID=T1JJE9_STRMM
MADDSLPMMDEIKFDDSFINDDEKVDATKSIDEDNMEFKELYQSLDIDVNNRSNRLNAIHIRGVNEMSTEDIGEYFTNLKFDSIEWIDDNSCNVVWENESLAAKAIVSKNKSIIKQDKQVSRVDNDDSEDGQIVSDDDNDEEKNLIPFNGENKDVDDVKNVGINDAQKLGIPVPPGQWVVGFPHEKSKGILMRFALKSDKKVPGAEKRSQYYLKHGNPNYGGMVGLISKSKKRSYRETFSVSQSPEHEKPEESIDIYESEIRTANKMPKMRMYADEESQKKRQKQLLSEDRQDRPPIGDLRNKLSSKTRGIVNYDENREHEDVKSSGDLRSKLRQRSKVRQSDERDEESEDETDLRRKLNQMRRRKRKPENLIIELTN